MLLLRCLLALGKAQGNRYIIAVALTHRQESNADILWQRGHLRTQALPCPSLRIPVAHL